MTSIKTKDLPFYHSVESRVIERAFICITTTKILVSNEKTKGIKIFHYYNSTDYYHVAKT